MPEQYLLTTDEMLKAMAFLGKELAYEIVVNKHTIN
jgi:DNA polymerase III alpha subunit (gram-positive type)